MNERGEVTLLSCLLILALMGTVLLCSVELQQNFKLMKKRTELFLCVKETKGEFKEYLRFMGRTNWGIKNITRASLVMLFIPGAQGLALNAEKMKRFIIYSQNAYLVTYLKTLNDLNKKGCPIDPRMTLTPFELGTSLYKRDSAGAAKLRKKSWTYYFLSKPYLIQVKVDAKNFEAINPEIKFVSEEKLAKLSSLLSSH